jgi:hypothetical protein
MSIPRSGTGHVRAKDGMLLRVDIVCGRWVATHFDSQMQIVDEFVGTCEQAHSKAEAWR